MQHNNTVLCNAHKTGLDKPIAQDKGVKYRTLTYIFFQEAIFFISWNRKCLAMLKVWVLDNLFLTLYAERGSVMRCSTICFGLKDFTWAPYEQAKTVSQTFTFVWRYWIAKFEIRVVNDYIHEHESLALGSPPFSYFHSFIFLNYCYWVWKHTFFAWLFL